MGNLWSYFHEKDFVIIFHPCLALNKVMSFLGLTGIWMRYNFHLVNSCEFQKIFSILWFAVSFRLQKKKIIWDSGLVYSVKMFRVLWSSPCSAVSHIENTFTPSHTHRETNKTLHIYMYICVYSLALFYTWLLNYFKNVLCLQST